VKDKLKIKSIFGGDSYKGEKVNSFEGKNLREVVDKNTFKLMSEGIDLKLQGAKGQDRLQSYLEGFQYTQYLYYLYYINLLKSQCFYFASHLKGALG
jgi:hypothetical protein